MTFCWLPQILTHQLLRLHNYTPHYLFLINFIMFIFSFGYPRYFFFPLPFCLYPFLMVEVEPLLSLSLTWSTPTSPTSNTRSLQLLESQPNPKCPNHAKGSSFFINNANPNGPNKSRTWWVQVYDYE